MRPVKKYITAYNSDDIINPLDENDIAENIEMLLEDKDLIKLMGDNGIKSISEEFNWKEEEKKLIDI
jgi:glycosyltransferase involved in cell wall biosynthesis